MENYRSFGEYLKNLRLNKNLTPEEVAEKINIKIDTVKRWERNLEIPELDNMYKLSEFYQVPCEHLLRLKEELFKPNTKAVNFIAKTLRNSASSLFNRMENPIRHNFNWSLHIFCICTNRNIQTRISPKATRNKKQSTRSNKVVKHLPVFLI